MFPFCISMSLSVDSCLSLDKLGGFDLTASDRGCFLHTTILQGVSSSDDLIKGWLSSGNSLITRKNFLNEIYLWDKFVKGNMNSYIVDFNSEYFAICLAYSFSNYITYISKNLVNEFSINNLMYDINKTDKLLQAFSESRSDYTKIRYALDFQYQSFSGLVKPHTTLGFYKKENFQNDKIDRISEQVNNILIKHNSIYLTTIDEYCMTPIVDRVKIINI